MRIPALILFALAAFPAFALNLGTAVASYDGAIYVTEFPNGDKPQGGTCPPTGFTGLALGGGSGSICDNGAGDLVLNVLGLNSIDDAYVVYKDCGGGECQIEGKILDSYTGTTQANAAVGVGIRESTAVDSWVTQCKSLQSGGTNAVQCQYGLASSPTNVWCAASGSSRPVWVAVTNYPTNSEVKGFTSSDGATWTECFSTTRSLSNDLAYAIGGSKSAVDTLSATLDTYAVLTEIDAYSETPAGGGYPTVSPIPDQTGSLNVAFSLTFSAYFTGATSYSLGSAFPGALSETSDGVLSGTPNATDVSSSPYSRDLCGTNSFGTTCDSVSFSFADVPGDVLAVPIGTNTVNCATYESGGPVDPDDILELEEGVHAPLTIINCHGTPSSPITIRNKTSAASAATIRRTSGGAPALTITNSTNWVLDGTGKWSGAPAGTCGYTYTTHSFGTTNCGIIVDTNGGSGGFVIRIDGTSCMGSDSDPNFCVIKGVEVDGSDLSGIGLSMNDHGVLSSDYPNQWRENVTVQNNYLHNIGNTIGEGMYLGPNGSSTAPDIPLRDITLRYNYLNDIARDCINLKSVFDGTNYIEYNYGNDCGMSLELTQNDGLALLGAADFEIRGNQMYGMRGSGMLFTWQDLAHQGPNVTKNVLIENEIYADLGLNASANRPAIKFGGDSRAYGSGGPPTQAVIVRHVTLASTPRDGIECASFTNVDVSNSILAGIGGTAITGCDSNTNNRTGSVASQFFVNSAADNYELTASSPACNAATGTSPTTDYEGEARPQDSNEDQGADEAAACP